MSSDGFATSAAWPKMIASSEVAAGLLRYLPFFLGLAFLAATCVPASSRASRSALSRSRFAWNVL
jgi:hypothetical protein